MHKIKPLRILLLIAAFWLLINLFWGLLLGVYPRHSWQEVLCAFSGRALAAFLTGGALQCIFLCVWSVPFGVVLLYYWLKKPTLFKAFLLAALGPYLGMLFFIKYPIFIASIFWTVGCLVAFGLGRFFVNLDRPLQKL